MGIQVRIEGLEFRVLPEGLEMGLGSLEDLQEVVAVTAPNRVGEIGHFDYTSNVVLTALTKMVYLLIPVSLAFGIVKYRLMEIDVIIRKTVIYSVVTGFVLLKLGLSGGNGMFVTMMVGGVVCTALAASGALASDLKVGYWIGATPSKQLGLKFVGTLVAAVFCGLMMWVMAQADPGQGFGSPNLPAPQASAMKACRSGSDRAHASRKSSLARRWRSEDMVHDSIRAVQVCALRASSRFNQARACVQSPSTVRFDTPRTSATVC